MSSGEQDLVPVESLCLKWTLPRADTWANPALSTENQNTLFPCFLGAPWSSQSAIQSATQLERANTAICRHQQAVIFGKEKHKNIYIHNGKLFKYR